MTHNNMGWNFDNSYARLPERFFESAEPTQVSFPTTVLFNKQLAEDLGLDIDELQTEKGTAVFAGNTLPEGAQPIAHAYAGHQFGNFTMLGDGRAVMLGEQIKQDGARKDIQLKGSGRTPFSRGGDGRATLGPMLREYIISEAMHALGIPTNRSLAVVTTGESVMREIELPGAVLTRVADSHLRIGTFEYAARWGTEKELRELADYAINRHYPDIEDNPDQYLTFFRKVVKRQAKLIADWQLVGFIHGVMNTDNMTISGQTIDYGPCAFMDKYDPATVFSSIDVQGRYAYQNQPGIGQWNLARFAEALLPLLHEKQEHAINQAKEILGEYKDFYDDHWIAGMRKKLGLLDKEEHDEVLIQDLLDIMEDTDADFTNTFRALTLDIPEKTSMHGTEAFTDWFQSWQERLSRQEKSKDEVHQLMKRSNPNVIPRNHLVEEALEAAVQKGDFTLTERLIEVLSSPYAYTDKQEPYTELPEPSDRPFQTYCGT